MAKRYSSIIFQKISSSKILQISIILLGISYILLILSSAGIIDLNTYKITYKNAIYIVTAVIVLASTSTAMFTYLQGSKKLSEQASIRINSLELKTELKKLELIIEQQRNDLLQYLTSAYQEKQKDPLHIINIENDDLSLQELRQRIKNVVNDDFINELNANISANFVAERSESISEIRHIGHTISDRLLREIEKLDRKSDINLIIGSITTIFAFIALAIVVFGQPSINHDLENILYHYIPRISFIVFIEVFAFFFLRLYKLNLNDIKYYQNELTNIEIKILSVISSVKFGLKEDVSAIVNELSKIERNFILEKGQTTIEFEKFKYENNSLDKFTKLLKNVLPKIK